MNILFGVAISLGCMLSFMAYLPFQAYIYLSNDKYDDNSKIDRLLKKIKFKNIDSYKELVSKKSDATIYAIVLLNFVCFISQFFNISHDLKVVILIINILFLLGILLNISEKKHLYSYILLLQDSASSEVALNDYFEIEYIESMPEQYKCYGEFMKIKDKIYYNKNEIKLVLTPRNEYNKKVGKSELAYIMDQLNNMDEEFNNEIKIKSLHNVPLLTNFSRFIVNDSVIGHSIPKGLKLFNKLYTPITIILSLLYLCLLVFSIAACCGTNWLYWFTF